MISFKTYLTESRSAPLYHATSLTAARSIIQDNGFSPLTAHNSFLLLKTPIKSAQAETLEGNTVRLLDFPVKTNRLIRGVSTTRSYRFALNWGLKNLALMSSGVIIFELDQQKIAQNYEIKPISWHHGRMPVSSEFPDKNEYEEFIVTNKVVPLKYVTKIYAGDLKAIKNILKLKDIQIKCEQLK